MLQFGCDLVAHGRNLIAHENGIGFESLPLFEPPFQLGLQRNSFLLQRFEFGNLLFERCPHPRLLAGRLIQRRQPRQVAGVARVDLGDTLPRLRECALGFPNLGLDSGQVRFPRPGRFHEPLRSCR